MDKKRKAEEKRQRRSDRKAAEPDSGSLAVEETEQNEETVDETGVPPITETE